MADITEVKVDYSNIDMASMRSYIEESKSSVNINAWIDEIKGEGTDEGRSVVYDTSEISSTAVANFDRYKASAVELEADPLVGDRLYILKLMIEEMTGVEIKILETEELSEETSTIEGIDRAASSDDNNTEERVGWGVSVDANESYHEVEETRFTASGIVKTADGQEINFSVDLKMAREISTSESVSLRLGDARLTDPLVINFGGPAATLTDTKFSFDLDSDGVKEDISFVTSGSGILVFDKNEDGVANNGSELFGPTTGKGFAELSAYDNDSNNWIDENDAVYNALSIWRKDSLGIDTLSSLKELNIGAIYLDNRQTSFDLKNAAYELNGRVATTGVYLNEEGGAGTVQQVDIAV